MNTTAPCGSAASSMCRYQRVEEKPSRYKASRSVTHRKYRPMRLSTITPLPWLPSLNFLDGVALSVSMSKSFVK